MLANPMMAALNPTITTYIVDIMSKQVRRKDKNVGVNHVITRLYLPLWVETDPFLL